MAADDFGGIEAHPLLQYRSVDAAEVDGVLHVLAVDPAGRVERRILGVQAAFDAVADDEGAAAGAMVGAAGIVADAAAELGEDEHRHLGRGVVGAQILEEGGDGAAQVGEKLGMVGHLVGVVVVAAVRGVEDARAQPGQMDAGHVAQATGDGAVAILHGRAVARFRLLKFGSPRDDVEAGLRKVVQHHAGADLVPIHALEDFQRRGAALRIVDAGEQTVGVQVVEGGHRHAGHGHRPRQPLADADAGEDVVAARVQLADHAPRPAFGADFDRFAGVPDIHGAEVGAVRIRVADALDHGNFAG